MRASETAEMIFDNCIIPDANRLGEVGDGFKQSMYVLDGGRISIACLGLGIAKGAFEAAAKYSKERHQFDQPISNFQAISFKIADMATEIDAAELLILRACELKNRNEKVTRAAAMAKYYASEVAVKVAKKRFRYLAAMVIQRISCRKILPRLKALHHRRRHIRDSENCYSKRNVE
jgi:alkylation response protein AidB-like acyl-CoA dehydrogenase